SDALTPMVSDDYAEVGSEAGASNKSVLLSSPAREQEVMEREIRVIDNYTALETGSVQGDGKRHGAHRYMSVWSWRDLRWQLLATHRSEVSRCRHRRPTYRCSRSLATPRTWRSRRHTFVSW